MRPPFGGLVLALALNYSAIVQSSVIDSVIGAFFCPTANRYHLVIRMPLYDKWPPRQPFLV